MFIFCKIIIYYKFIYLLLYSFKDIVFILFFESWIPYYKVTLSSVSTEIYRAFYETHTSRLLSANQNIIMSLISEVLISFLLLFPFDNILNSLCFDVGGMEQHFRKPLLIVIGCVNIAS